VRTLTAGPAELIVCSSRHREDLLQWEWLAGDACGRGFEEGGSVKAVAQDPGIPEQLCTEQIRFYQRHVLSV
jgi:hypothetical protein